MGLMACTTWIMELSNTDMTDTAASSTVDGGENKDLHGVGLWLTGSGFVQREVRSAAFGLFLIGMVVLMYALSSRI